jgi:large subunit ribosomal protein L19
LPTTKVDPSVNVLDEIVSDQLRTDLPELAAGDTVRVSAKVIEGTRERIQVFEGIVMRLRGGGITRSITVRRIASGVGVERTFKVNSPRIERIEVMRHGQVRRAQLYFLRKRVGKAATLRERRPKAQAAGAAAGSKTKARGSKAKATAAKAEASGSTTAKAEASGASGSQGPGQTPDSKA